MIKLLPLNITSNNSQKLQIELQSAGGEVAMADTAMDFQLDSVAPTEVRNLHIPSTLLTDGF